MGHPWLTNWADQGVDCLAVVPSRLFSRRAAGGALGVIGLALPRGCMVSLFVCLVSAGTKRRPEGGERLGLSPKIAPKPSNLREHQVYSYGGATHTRKPLGMRYGRSHGKTPKKEPKNNFCSDHLSSAGVHLGSAVLHSERPSRLSLNHLG